MSFYIDTPLSRLFAEYGAWNRDIGRSLERSLANQALQREKQAYQEARFVICRSSAAASILKDEYGIDASKVHHIMPGANLTEEVVNRYTAGLDQTPIKDSFASSSPLRLGFIGKEYLRKGLPRLIDAARILNATGIACEVAVIGHMPNELKRDPVVRYLGFFDKKTQEPAFVHEVMNFDIGCLPSHAEALGLGTLECLRLGVPVLGARVGGIPDAIPADCGILVDAEATGEQIAERIRPLAEDPTRYVEMRRAARQRRDYYSWNRTIREFKELWNSRPNFTGGRDRPIGQM